MDLVYSQANVSFKGGAGSMTFASYFNFLPTFDGTTPGIVNGADLRVTFAA